MPSRHDPRASLRFDVLLDGDGRPRYRGIVERWVSGLTERELTIGVTMAEIELVVAIAVSATGH